MKITKNKFLLGFAVVVVLLAIIRAVFPGVDNSQQSTVNSQQTVVDSQELTANSQKPRITGKKHRILGVHSYKESFPDSQAVQILAAEKWGVRPVRNREDAEARKKELVYVGPVCEGCPL